MVRTTNYCYEPQIIATNHKLLVRITGIEPPILTSLWYEPRLRTNQYWLELRQAKSLKKKPIFLFLMII